MSRGQIELGSRLFPARGTEMKVVVLGAQGMLGHIVTTVLEERGHSVTSVSRNGSFGSLPVAINLADWNSIEALLDHIRPDWVVNAAGVLNENADKRIIEALLINSVLPQRLAQLGSQLSFRTITMGSDCVFDGKNGGYAVNSPSDALSCYGRTKYLGEISNDRDLTIRTSIVGPEIRPGGRGLMLWFMSQAHEAEGWTEAIWTGVTTLEVAKAIEALISGYVNLTGIWQMVPTDSVTKFELLTLINKEFLNNRVTIREVSGIPHNRSLINNHAEEWQVPSYLQMLVELNEWIHTHQHLYGGTVFERPYGKLISGRDPEHQKVDWRG